MISIQYALRRRLIAAMGGGKVKQATGTATGTTNANSRVTLNASGLGFAPRTVIEYGISGSGYKYMTGVTLLNENGTVVFCRSCGTGALEGTSLFTLRNGGFTWVVNGWAEGDQTTYRWIALDIALDNTP